MNFYAKSSAYTLCLSLLAGCSTITDPINYLRQNRQDQKSIEYNKDIAKNRSAAIQDSETAFSSAIACLSNNWLTWQAESLTTQGSEYQQQVNNKIKNDQNLKNFATQNSSYDIQVVNAIAKEKKDLEHIQQKLILEKKLLDKKIDDGGNVIKRIQKDGTISITQYRGISQQEQKKYLEIEAKLKANSQRVQELSSLQLLIGQAKSPTASLRDAHGLFRISVSPIFDKTGKIYDKDSTALSDLVTHALTYNDAINVVDTPYNSDSATISRATLNDATSFGQAFPSVMFISGALVQYDEGSTSPYLDYLRLNLDKVDLSKEIKSITVGLVLRLVQSSDSAVYQNKFFVSQNEKEIAILDSNIKQLSKTYYQADKDGKDTAVIARKLMELNEKKQQLLNDDTTPKELLSGSKPLSVMVENTFFTQDMGGGILRIIGSKNWSIDIHSTVSDPKMYAVREMIEKAIYELLKRAIPEHKLTGDQKVVYSGWQTASVECDNLLPVAPAVTKNTMSK